VVRELDTTRILCALADLGEQGCRGFAVGGGDWPLQGFVLRLPNGEPRAFLNWCPHQGHRLNLLPHKFLTKDGALVMCHSHGAVFERDQGRCLWGPCVGKHLLPVPIELTDGYVLLSQEANISALAASIDRS
jgi:nitrite reductase/ring-hydroxylating ferredoxin subunit